MVRKRWPGIVPVSLLVVALMLLWTQWVWSRVAPPEPNRPVVTQVETTAAAGNNCSHTKPL